MSAIDFPGSPSVGDTHVVGDRGWIWTGTLWNSTGSAAVTGPTGAQGATGDTGPTGPQGTDIHFVGSVSNTGALPTNASVNDAYIVDADGNLWVWSADSEWVDAGQIVGPIGPTGTQGPTGPQGPDGKFYVSDTAPTAPSAGDGWFDSASSTIYIYYDGYWIEPTTAVVGPTGAAGADGSDGADGATGPAGADGEPAMHPFMLAFS